VIAIEKRIKTDGNEKSLINLCKNHIMLDIISYLRVDIKTRCTRNYLWNAAWYSFQKQLFN